MTERDRTWTLVVVSTALFLSVLVWFNYSAVLPYVVDDWGLSGLRAGVVFSAFQAGYLLAIVPLGSVADRYSPRWVIAGGATVTGVASIGFALVADGFLAGTALRFLAGMGMAGVYVPGMRFVADWYDADARGRAMGVYVGTFSAGSGVSFLLSSGVAAAAGWRTAVGVTSVGALAVAPLMIWAARDAPGTADRESSGLGFPALGDRSYRSAVGVYAWHNWELFGVRNWVVAFLVAAPAVAAMAESGAIAGTLAGVMILVGSLGNVAGGWLSDRWGRRRVIGVALGSSAVISAVVGSLGWLPLPALVAVVCGYGVVLTMDSSPTSTMITELVADENVGMALSVQSFLGFTTTVVSPVVFGAALDYGGFAVAFPTLAVGAVLGLAFLRTIETAG